MFKLSVLWSAPEVNPVTKKARSIPVFNPINQYGRVFFFSWFGFLIAFWSWYAFPPLLTKTIKADLHLSQNEIANSNIAALVATLLVRLASGTLCDKFGPRYVFAGCLLAGAIPTAMAGLVKNAAGLIALRFFVGILGASFVPCQVWSTGWFDKNVVGSANALTGGLGNSGGGITYFAMPAIFDSLVHTRGLTPHTAWRVSFIVPFILITITAIGMLTVCSDTPSGKWSERFTHLEQNLANEERAGHVGHIATASDMVTVKPKQSESATSSLKKEKGTETPREEVEAPSQAGEVIIVEEYQHEAVQNPTGKETLKVMASPQTLVLAACYACSFGAELAINSILGAYYYQNFHKLGQTGSGKWAAMFGLVNVLFRPTGGFVSDLLYRYTNGSLWAKKIWIHFVGISSGIFAIAIGRTDPHDLTKMIGLVVGMAFFIDAGNGANFGLVPHVHPYANGIVSGVTGASGNLGGVIFAIIFRYNGTHYARVIWIIGVITIGINLAVCWIKPIPKGQIGGR